MGTDTHPEDQVEFDELGWLAPGQVYFMLHDRWPQIREITDLRTHPSTHAFYGEAERLAEARLLESQGIRTRRYRLADGVTWAACRAAVMLRRMGK